MLAGDGLTRLLFTFSRSKSLTATISSYVLQSLLERVYPLLRLLLFCFDFGELFGVALDLDLTRSVRDGG